MLGTRIPSLGHDRARRDRPCLSLRSERPAHSRGGSTSRTRRLLLAHVRPSLASGPPNVATRRARVPSRPRRSRRRWHTLARGPRPHDGPFPRERRSCPVGTLGALTRKPPRGGEHSVMVLPIALQPNRIGTIAAFCLAAATGCGSSPSAAPGGVEIADGGGDGEVPGARVDQANVARDPASGIPGSTLDAAVAANNAFGLDLYGQLMGDGGGGNVLISPLSASLALTMTYAGAEGETASEMASVLHANLPDGGSIFDGQNALDQALLGRGSAAFAQAQNAGGEPAPVATDYQLQIANAVWGEETYPWSSGFLTTLARSYGTGVYLADFANAPGQAVVAINDWVSAETAGKITNLLAPTDVTASTAMVLVNALHVKFPWDSPFDPSATAPATFTRADGTTVSPSFMNQTTTLPYDDDGQAQIVALPLYADEEALVVILPHADTSLASYEATLVTNGGLPQPGSSQDVALSIPKITLGGTTF